MANTYVDYTGDGSETDFAINFDYIKTSHVAVEVNEGPAGGTNVWVRKTLGSDYTVVTSPTKQVVFTSAPANLVRVRVLRDSDANVGIVDFANGSVLTETELDNAYNHNRYLAQEAEEGASGGGFTKNPDGQYDADGLRIENLAAPDSDDDAANKSYVDTATAAAVATEASARISGDNDQVSKTGDTMSGNLAMGGNKVTGLGTPGAGTDAANKTYVDDTVASVTAGTIPDGSITTAKLADDAVTAAKLDNTTVTPGSYTNTDITVDENGRITAASNGSGGATNLGVTHNAENVDVTSSTGDDITLNRAVASAGATPGTAGLMADGDKEKLDGIATGAQTGTVTSITADGNLTGGTITTSGTISNLDSNGIGLIGSSITANTTDVFDGTTTYKAQVQDGIRINNTTGAAKLKLNSDLTSGGGTSITFDTPSHTASNNGKYSIFIGAASGLFNIKNERAVKSVLFDQNGDWYALSNTQDLGKTGNRWDDVWSNGTFNGSDRNIKQDIQDLDEAEKRVAVKCKSLIKKYRLRDAVARKGNDARIHVGIIAQELQAAFESEGLDPFRYSMIGKDTWWETTDAHGNRDVKYEATAGYTEVTQMSVRYNELLAFIISAL